MLLNLFFENMNGKLELFLLGAFIFAIYWFILRRYNALGLRLFVLCFLLFIGCCVWIYKDEMNLKATLNAGEEHIAVVTAKSKKNGKDNEVSISFTARDGKTINTSTSDYVSLQEWDRFEYGKPVSVIYVPSIHQTFVQQSIMRFKGDKIYLYGFAGFWLVTGLVLLIWLRNIKVGVDENTGAEWLVKKDGTIMFDERRSQAAQTMKKVNIVSKMFQAFAK